MSYERDPDFFAGLKTQGTRYQVIAGIENNQLLCFGCRSTRPLYINGIKQKFGYLSGLRSSDEANKKLALCRGYKKLKELHQNDQVKAYITTIIDKNSKALEILTSARAGLPFYRGLSTCHTYAVLSKKRNVSKESKSALNVRRAAQGEEDLIIMLLNKYGRLFNFFPVFSENDFGTETLNCLNTQDFLIAEKYKTPVGVAAMWDQSGFKQNRIINYPTTLKLSKPFINILLKILGYHPLPAEGSLLPQTYICFKAVKNNDPEILYQIIKKALELNTTSPFCITGFHQKDRARKIMSRFLSIDYRSMMYWVDWDESKENFSRLDKRTINFEPAIM
ncbi:MAG: hypothetical protein ACOC2E_01710 [Bacteroidota bacterium]